VIETAEEEVKDENSVETIEPTETDEGVEVEAETDKD